jgi:hypothetical protein
MRNILLVVTVVSAACAAPRAAQNTFPRAYTCGDGSVVPHGNRLEIRQENAALEGGVTLSARLGFHDDAGDHYVAGPHSPVDVSAVEYIVPGDGHSDATRNQYDTSAGTSRADWRLVKAETCTMKGGDSEVLAHYIKGESLEDLTHDFSLADRDDAREAVHRAMLQLQKRYFEDR